MRMGYQGNCYKNVNSQNQANARGVSRNLKALNFNKSSTYRQFQQSFGALRDVHVGEWRQRVSHRRNHPLLEQCHYHIDTNHNLQDALQQESLANPWSAREVQLVAQGRRKEEIEQILDVQIVRVLDQFLGQVALVVFIISHMAVGHSLIVLFC